jgi:hypothetical protein
MKDPFMEMGNILNFTNSLEIYPPSSKYMQANQKMMSSKNHNIKK